MENITMGKEKTYMEDGEEITVTGYSSGLDAGLVDEVTARVEYRNVRDELYDRLYKDTIEPEYADGIESDSMKDVLYDLTTSMLEIEEYLKALHVYVTGIEGMGILDTNIDIKILIDDYMSAKYSKVVE